MQKKILTLLLFATVFLSMSVNAFASVFIPSQLMNIPASLSSLQKSNALPKGHPRFHVLRDRGKLIFHFTTFLYAEDVLVDVTGQWQAFILTPDQRKFKGPKIDVSAPPSQFEILVDSPILFGNYTIVIENISAKYIAGQDFIGSFIEPNVTVTNNFNSKVATTFVFSASIQTFIPANNPIGSSVQGFFVPPLNFVH